MSVTASTTNIQSNILAYESLKEKGFCREQVTVDNTGDTMKLGSVLYRTVDRTAALTVYSAWTEVDDTDLGDAAVVFTPTAVLDVEFAVIIGTDEIGGAHDTSGVDIPVSATAKVIVLVRGAAVLRKQYLAYTGTASAAKTDVLVDNMKLRMPQVMVVDGHTPFDGTYSDVAAL